MNLTQLCQVSLYGSETKWHNLCHLLSPANDNENGKDNRPSSAIWSKFQFKTILSMLTSGKKGVS